MLSDLTDQQWFTRLDNRRTQFVTDTAKYWQYYDNEQPLAYVARILVEQGDRFPPLRINWPALVVDSLEERLDIEGFRLGGADSPDDTLAAVWQANDLDEGSGEAHIAALVARQAYIWSGPGEGDSPLITVEYPDQVAVEIDPATRRVVAALKVWSEDQDSTTQDMAALQLPGRLIVFERGKKVSESAQAWGKALERHQTSPLVPVVPVLNRPRRGLGRSELDQIIPLADGVNQTATNMLAAIEHHALPRRWATNVSEADFQDADGKPIPAWKIATGAVWAVPRGDDDNDGSPDKTPVVGQFAAAELTNFHNSIKQLATLAASLYGLPPHYLGYSSENPASADAIRSSEARLVKRAERRQRAFGGAWERAMRIALTIMGGDPKLADRLETVWRDPATPTRASKADAAVKLVASGIIDQDQSWDDLGYTAGQQQRMRERRSQSGVGNILSGLRSLDLAQGAAPLGVTGASAAGGI